MRTAIAKAAMLAVAALTLTTTANAQQINTRFEVRPFVGALVPTGDNREVFKDAFLTGFSPAYRVQEHVAVVGTFGWAA